MKEPVLFKNSHEFFAPGSRFALSDRLEVKKGMTATRMTEWSKVVGNGPQVASLEIIAEENSNLEYIFFQNFPLHGEGSVETASIESIGKINIVAHANARVNLTLVQNGSSKSHLLIETHCEGKDSEIHIRGLQHAKENQKLSIEVNAIHSVPHTKSDLQVWCLAKDHSQSVFNGLVTIQANAHHTEAYQKNKNLILSEKATVDSFPKLLIANDEVKCAHGSSTSTLDPEQTLYLQSRGIDAATAEKMLVNGFIAQAMDWLTDEKNRAHVIREMGVTQELEALGVWSEGL